MAMPVTESASHKKFTATNSITANNISLLGIFVASSTNGTIAINSGSTPVVGAFPVSSGQFYPIPVQMPDDCTIIVTGTLDATAIFSA